MPVTLHLLSAMKLLSCPCHVCMLWSQLTKGPFPSLGTILVDQGKADKFLDQQQLTPHVLQEACEKKGQSMQLRIHDGYDHSYYFVSSFGEEHINFHADALATL
eukprot:TRINITY_DN3795_c0_g1_i3.p2 TRINITY_DN3795_c0_g1~~TRINITY_DN3795_c0_g1_i3.p2  ORF type:complete len:104 (+),score=20.76 TRINITY_DN3795_c0_g1_i3:235-546(+)